MSTVLSPQDLALLARTVDLATSAIGLTEPNPRVGCVLHDRHGRLAGEGHTQQAGGPHAEVMALRAAQAAGIDLSGGTAWVSLEPCAHHGRTPPCADALVKAGLARVVVAMTDPFPQVAGQGIARLRAAGIQVDLAGPEVPARQAATALNIGFLSRVLRGRPWVRMKLAASLDGRTALPNGQSQWITGPAARTDGHAWRRRAGAVLTGIGTVLADDPGLDVRLVPTAVQPRRVVLDSQLRTPPTACVLSAPGPCVLVHATGSAEAIDRLQQAGATCCCVPDASGRRIDLNALLAHPLLAGMNELHLEAGPTLSAAWWQAGLVDELLLYLAPRLLGPGQPLLDLPELALLESSPRWQFLEVRPVGDDLAVRLQAHGAGSFAG